MLHATGISKSFGSTRALNGVDFSVAAGEILALAGENGSGKSTLMRILHGEITPDSGAMTLQGQPFSPKKPLDAMRSGIALIHQELAIADHLSAVENIWLGAEDHRVGWLSRNRMKEVARDCLGRLGRADLAEAKFAQRLSPAERQLLEIARALRSEARVVLFDEPTSCLGRGDTEALFRAIRSMAEQGIACVYITHFLDEIFSFCESVTVLHDGQNSGEAKTADLDATTLASMMAGRNIELVFPNRASHACEMLVRGEGLELRRGEIVGLAGLIGSGRTEKARRLFGLDRGRAVVWEDLSFTPSPSSAWEKGMGFVSEDRKSEGLSLHQTLVENLTLGNMGNGVVNHRRLRERTQGVIDRFGVKCGGPHVPARALSGGNQQKIALGRLFDRDSQFLILDEPTRGIDVRSKGEIYEWIAQMAASGKSILLISSQFSELIGMCDRIVVLKRGEMVAEVLAAETTESALLELAGAA